MNVDLIGVPLDLGSHRIGSDMGPDALRYQGYVKNLKSAGLNVNDNGNITCPSAESLSVGNNRIKYKDSIARTCKTLKRHVLSSIQNKRKVLVVGGDHSIAIGSISGAQKALKGTLGVIWIDAHADLNTPQTTPSGNIHGMPLAVLFGKGDKTLTTIVSDFIEYKNAELIGLKDTDEAEDAFVQTHNLNAFYIKNILSHGLKPVFQSLDSLSQRVDHIWVSLDLDAIDQSEAPGVGMPNKGGLTYREIYSICEHIGRHDIIGMDLVEYNPVSDHDHITAELASELTAALFGKKYSQYTNYLSHHGIR